MDPSSPIRNQIDQKYFSEETLEEINNKIDFWTILAERFYVNIDIQKKDISEITNNMPSPDSFKHDMHREVSLIQQIVLKSMYCNQIIREIMIHQIETSMVNARNICDEELYPDINLFESKLKTFIPKKICLKQTASIEKDFSEVAREITNLNILIKSNTKILPSETKNLCRG